MMNFEQACQNMITQQLRTNNVLDEDLLRLIKRSQRELFVPEQFQDVAYADMQIPLGDGQVMMSPMDESRMIQELSIHATDSILEIGTGSGYVTSLLASLGHDISTIDNRENFVKNAESKIVERGLHNIEYIYGDCFEYEFGKQFDVIAITGSMLRLPKSLQQILAPNGRMFAILGSAPQMEAYLITNEHNSWQQRALFETNIVALDNGPQPERFVF